MDSRFPLTTLAQCRLTASAVPYCRLPLRSQLRPFLRWTAAGCILLVLVLAVLAASPDLHELLHHDAAHEDHACAVTLFMHGVEGVTDSLMLVLVAFRLVGWVSETPAVLWLLHPRYFLRPGRAPPGS